LPGDAIQTLVTVNKAVGRERELRRAGCYLKREGASHVLWLNPRTGTLEA
jgi:hypothetical protein